jgi:aldose 1-epimerase
MPWPNRLADGAYEFDGREHRLPITEASTNSAIHGLVRDVEWTVGERESNRVVMQHALRPQPGYPFSLDVRVEYSVSRQGLTVRTTAVNVGDEACPFVLQVPARTVMHSRDRALDFRNPRPIGSVVLDHTFADLDRDGSGTAVVNLRGPDHGVAIWLDEAYGFIQVFTGDPLPDVARRSLAVEPMTCPANAFRTGVAVVRLEPGDAFSGAWGTLPS